MLPFLTASAIPSIAAWRPHWVLWCFLAASVGHGAMEQAGLSRIAWMLDASAAAFLFWLLQTATLLRLASELWPRGYAWLATAAILTWLAAFAGWAWKYVPAYLRPRADGKPG